MLMVLKKGTRTFKLNVFDLDLILININVYFRAKQFSDENSQLKKNLRTLQTENERLKAAMKRLQNAIAPGGTTTQPGTCLMIFLMSVALLIAPSYRPTVTEEKDLMSLEGQESSTAVPGWCCW